MALGQDIVTRIVNIQWSLVDQQGLLAEYPPGPGAPESEAIGEVMNGTPTAFALDSGQSFPGVNMGASGLGHTVLTPGLVCFGTPRDGASCFIAAPGFKYLSGGSDALKRGFLNESGDLVWESTGGGGGKLMALSFAEDAFFATYVDFSGDSPKTNIATSFDGETWSSGSAFPSISSRQAAHGGAVAATFKIIKDEDGADKKLVTYVAAGEIEQDNSEIANSVSNLMWATSSNGSAWNSGSNTGTMAEPGTWYNFIFNYACTVAAGSISTGKQIFVAAAGTKTSIANPNNPDLPYAMLTSAPAVSETGSGWSVTAVGLPAGLDQISFGLAVTYCRRKDKSGYFLMSDHEYITGELGHAVPNSNLYKSSDGRTWSKIRTNKNWMATLSAIAKDLNATTIVRI